MSNRIAPVTQSQQAQTTQAPAPKQQAQAAQQQAQKPAAEDQYVCYMPTHRGFVDYFRDEPICTKVDAKPAQPFQNGDRKWLWNDTPKPGQQAAPPAPRTGHSTRLIDLPSVRPMPPLCMLAGDGL
jgi:hypothetical protein